MTENTRTVKLSSVTKHYEGNGRKLGYPTANISVSTDLAEGVYFGFANLGKYKNHPALVFIGTPVTMGAGTHRVEAHLLDITDKDYYDKLLQLKIHHFHRPNQHFGSIKELMAAMKTDELVARAWFTRRREH